MKIWSSTATEHGHDIIRKLSVRPPCRLTAAPSLGHGDSNGHDTWFPEYSAWLGAGQGKEGRSGPTVQSQAALGRAPSVDDVCKVNFHCNCRGESTCASALRSPPTKSGYFRVTGLERLLRSTIRWCEVSVQRKSRRRHKVNILRLESKVVW